MLSARSVYLATSGSGDVLTYGFNDGLRCEFEGEPSVAATYETDNLLLCTSPAASALGADPPNTFDPRALGVTFEGGRAALNSTPVPTPSFSSFYFYDNQRVRVSRIYPAAGPVAGGTPVTVWGTGLVDLDGGGGLQCSFPGARRLVPAALSAPSAPFNVSGGGGEERLVCTSPPLELPPGAFDLRQRLSPVGNASAADFGGPGTALCPAAAPLRLTLNGNNPDAGSGDAGDGSGGTALTTDDGANVSWTFYHTD